MKAIRHCFLFAMLVYASLYTVDLALSDLAGMGGLFAGWHHLWNLPAAWLGGHAWHLPKEAFASDASGDSPLEFGRSLAFACVAFAVGALATFVDRRDNTEDRYLRGLSLVLRFGLAADLFVYGFIKVFPSQFPPVDGSELMTPLRELAPQSLYWATIGAAPAYQVFAGCVEAGTAVLLSFRRTALVGSLLAAGVMANVFMINLAYDIPVKLRALHLLAMAAVLVMMEGRRVGAFLFGGQVPDQRAPKRPRWAGLMALGLFGWAFLGSAVSAHGAWRRQQSGRLRPLVGSYEPESMTVNGVDRPLLITDPAAWRCMWIAELGPVLEVVRMDGTDQGFYLKVDTAARTLTLQGPSIQGISTLHYTEPDKDHLVLEGQLGSETLRVRLRKLDTAAMPLLSEGTHWIEN